MTIHKTNRCEYLNDGINVKPNSSPPLSFSPKNERKILKALLLSRINQLLCELFSTQIQFDQNCSTLECYRMDSKVIQLLIQGIVESGEYTLEGIAFYTHIPFDVLYEAACGIGNQFSITPWARVVDLYIQIKPDIAQVLISRLIEVVGKNSAGLSSLLNE